MAGRRLYVPINVGKQRCCCYFMIHWPAIRDRTLRHTILECRGRCKTSGRLLTSSYLKIQVFCVTTLCRRRVDPFRGIVVPSASKSVHEAWKESSETWGLLAQPQRHIPQDLNPQQTHWYLASPCPSVRTQITTQEPPSEFHGHCRVIQNTVHAFHCQLTPSNDIGLSMWVDSVMEDVPFATWQQYKKLRNGCQQSSCNLRSPPFRCVSFWVVRLPSSQIIPYLPR